MNHKQTRILFPFLVSILLVASVPGLTLAYQSTAAPNVLFIAVDDLRPELNCYGQQHIHSPNIDGLAMGGVLFEQAYCMVPTCGASRASLMTGVRPARNRFVTYLTRADEDAPGVTTLNTHFKRNGYQTISLGKVFHHRADSQSGWSSKPWRPSAQGYQLAANRKLHNRTNAQGKKLRGPAFESADQEDESYADGMIANKAIEELERLAEQDDPFFLAVGFLKPHLPFVAPQKYWDLYDPANIKLPENYREPTNVPDEAIHSSGELRAYHGIPPKGPVTEETARNLIHGYYACVSFTDAQIGRILSELNRLQLADNTIVVLWGDHGWNLGDHTLWCKHSCFESSMHAPLIVSAPGIKGGQRTKGLTEFIDIYPSLCELAGLPKPDHLQGESFVKLLREPGTRWKAEAIGRFQNGDTIRTERFRFSQYSTKAGQPVSRMLYDHFNDPLENTNVAESSASRQDVESLSRQLQSKMGRDSDLKSER